MRPLLLLPTLWVLLSAVAGRGRQIPVIDGVLGGVPANLSQPIERGNYTVRSTPTPGKLRVVENSGVCETTPGVYQASGYGDLSATQSIWYADSLPNDTRMILIHYMSQVLVFRVTQGCC